MGKTEMYDSVVAYITENQEKFYRFAYSHTKNRDSALDIVQNAVCKAIEKYTDIRNIESINAWFYRVLLNEVYAYLKKYSRELATPDEEMPEGGYTEKAFEKDDALYQCIDKLEPALRTIIILRFFEDMPLEEISKITATNLNTVKTRLYGAIKKLKKLYEEAEQ